MPGTGESGIVLGLGGGNEGVFTSFAMLIKRLFVVLKLHPTERACGWWGI